MPSYELEYPKQPFSTVNRYNNRASYSLQQIHQIINTTHFVNVSFTDPTSPFPVTIPMIGQMGSFTRPSADTGDVLDLYLHGYISSRLLNTSRSSSNNNTDSNGGDQEKEKEEGLAITVSATHVDGLVLSLTPNSHSYNYRSAVLFGRAVPVTDPAERLWAMELITNGVVPDRWRQSRLPPTAGEQASTGVLRVAVAAGSAKIRSGMPSDDRHDLDDAELRARVWTGVVPAWSHFGEPLPAPDNRVAALPEYLGGFVRDSNEVAREKALEQAAKTMRPKKEES
ncbi:hypothetical protein PFICI_10590 [Pestalotiopsis fici W106-1]|uniref:Flavin-nucleotide-binding protein n=1 Tax=Pestalotiopsis fici (strain W106-1 / CGMCC3.15140) TaxID=1229662 RepID=W3WXC4_PESFW|nr:uncharacterized protein PFICI_10590 [Pestalotiopsis fici W106-1]ETS78528.1 hypothetical protein PFICI_10590 [Pestalotiopsis fici W106-1]